MIINPFVSVGPLKFGASRDFVRKFIRGNFTSFKKVVSSNDTDEYLSLGLHLYYDNDDLLEFIETFKPAILEYDGVVLTDLDLTELLSFFEKLGCDVMKSDVGYKVATLGIAITAPYAIIEGIAVHRKNYYDS